MAATSPTAGKRSKQPRPRGLARREALLEAVLKVVAEVGADAVTHRRVAEVAGLPLASTTYWFDSKEHLLTAALELAATRDIARLQGFVDSNLPDGADPIELAVTSIMEPCETSYQSSRGSLLATYALMLEAARRPALQAITRRWSSAYLDALAELLSQTTSSDPRGDAELLLAAADGLLVGQLASGKMTDLTPKLRALATTLVQGKRRAA